MIAAYRTRSSELTPAQVVSVQRSPPNVQGLLSASFLGESSPMQAIKAKCVECVGCEEWVERVGQCSVRLCPLWAYRPYQEKSI